MKDRRARNTPKWADYQEKVLQAFVEQTGAKLLRQITPAMIESWQRARKRATSLNTARPNFTTVRAWLRWAKRMKYLQEDPSESVQPLGRPPKKEIRFLSEKEAKRLLVACRKPVPLLGPAKKGNGRTRDRKTPLVEIVAVGLYAGFRLGEIRHLRWEDVDFQSNGGVLHVRVTETFTPKDKEGVASPCTRAWERSWRPTGGRLRTRRTLSSAPLEGSRSTTGISCVSSSLPPKGPRSPAAATSPCSATPSPAGSP